MYSVIALHNENYYYYSGSLSFILDKQTESVYSYYNQLLISKKQQTDGIVDSPKSTRVPTGYHKLAIVLHNYYTVVISYKYIAIYTTPVRFHVAKILSGMLAHISITLQPCSQL